ncbi:hypothetical protein D3C74_243230 [compost metagenome]
MPTNPSVDPFVRGTGNASRYPAGFLGNIMILGSFGAICVVAALREYVPDVRGLAPR